MRRRVGSPLGSALIALSLTAACSGGGTAPVAVSQTEVCDSPGGSFARPAGDATLYRGVPLTCTVEASDPRVRGRQTGVLSLDEHADGSAEIWLDYHLANAAGGWVGAATGLIAAGYTTHRLHVSAVGTGGYAGFRLELDVSSEDGRTLTATGTIMSER